MGFTKLDELILQSSIMAESAKTFKVWITLLAACGEDGIARMSSTFLASTCHLSLKDIDHAIGVLEDPDPRSRSLNDDGRRVRRVDGGFFVINYQAYRDRSYSKSKEAKRKRIYRQRVDDGTRSGHVPNVPDVSASASVLYSSSSFLVFISEWNVFAEKAGLRKINGVIKGSKREAHLKARIAEGGFDFKVLIETIEKSPFLLGVVKPKEGEQPFRATFDWIICPSNYQKIIEGNYLAMPKADDRPTMKPDELSRIREQVKRGEYTDEDIADMERHYSVSLR